MHRSPEYRSWSHMKGRCYCESDPGYHNYGGRGIGMHEDWREDFQAFFDYIGPRPGPGFSVDRIDNDGNYEPGNVRWATQKQQSRNFRHNRVLTFEGQTKCLVEWAEEIGVNRRTLQVRLSRGWSVERALTKPPAPKRSRKGGVTWNGKTKSLPEWERETGVPFKTIASRLLKGWSPEEAITIPAVRGANQTLRKR